MFRFKHLFFLNARHLKEMIIIKCYTVDRNDELINIINVLIFKKNIHSRMKPTNSSLI